MIVPNNQIKEISKFTWHGVDEPIPKIPFFFLAKKKKKKKEENQ